MTPWILRLALGFVTPGMGGVLWGPDIKPHLLTGNWSLLAPTASKCLEFPVGPHPEVLRAHSLLCAEVVFFLGGGSLWKGLCMASVQGQHTGLVQAMCKASATSPPPLCMAPALPEPLCSSNCLSVELTARSASAPEIRNRAGARAQWGAQRGLRALSGVSPEHRQAWTRN